MKKKILIDLDVVTVAEWNTDKNAINFLDRVKKGEFVVHTPYILLELLSKWKYEGLALKIEHFYNLYSETIISAHDVLKKLREFNVDRKKLTSELLAKGVKEEDTVLVIVTSIFELDYLVTYNRKHLRSKEEIINVILNKNGCKSIKVKLPDEI